MNEFREGQSAGSRRRQVKWWFVGGALVTSAAAVVAVGVVLGPSNNASGVATVQASSVPSAPPVPATDSFGWDPCGYLSPELYTDVAGTDPATGRPRVQINANSFGTCEVHIALPGDPYQEILVSSVFHQTSTPAAIYDDHDRFDYTTHGEWTLAAQREPSHNTCNRAVFSDRSWAMISVSRFADRRPIEIGLCELVDRAATALLDVLRTRAMPRLSMPPESLGTLDTCALLSDVEVTGAVPLAGWAPPDDQHRAHTCLRKSPIATPRADLPSAFTLGVENDLVEVRTSLEQRPLRSNDRNTFRTVAGRDTAFRLSGMGTCEAVTEGRNSQPWPGHQVFDSRNQPPTTTIETITISVIFTQRTGQDACRAAQDLAALAWPRLP